MSSASAASRLLRPFAAAATAAAAAYGFSSTASSSSTSAPGWWAPSQLRAQADQPATTGLDPNAFVSLQLIAKQRLTHNSYLLRFELPGGNTLPVASCILAKAALPAGDGSDKPKVVVRPYTPVTSPDDGDHLDLVVKAYTAGKLSKHMGEMKIGDTLSFKGPIPKYKYEPNALRHIGMVAGGTGITPMLQVADAILSNPADRTKVSLVFANVSEADILLKDKIDGMAAQHPDRFSAFYVVDKPSWGGLLWKGGVGYVTQEMLAPRLPAPGAPNTVVFVCGPPGMMAAVSGDKAPDKSQGELSGLLAKMGYKSEQVYKF